MKHHPNNQAENGRQDGENEDMDMVCCSTCSVHDDANRAGLSAEGGASLTPCVI